MRHPIFTHDMIDKVGHSLLTTGKWTIASQSWGTHFYESVFHAVIYRFHMLGVLFTDL